MRNLVWLVVLALAIVVAAGFMGFSGPRTANGSRTAVSPAVTDTKPGISAVSQDTDPKDIPAPVAYTQTYTVSTTPDNDVVEYSTGVARVKINQSDSYEFSREYLEYMNAPAITWEQKESALRIALTSKKFQDYMNQSHGPISFGWAYPYSGMVRLSMKTGSATSPVYGLVSVNIDIDRGVLDNENFTDWKKYW